MILSPALITASSLEAISVLRFSISASFSAKIVLNSATEAERVISVGSESFTSSFSTV